MGLEFKLTISLQKELSDYLLIKNSFINSNALLKLKQKELVVWLEHHKMKFFILIHIPNLLLGFNIWSNIRW